MFFYPRADKKLGHLPGLKEFTKDKEHIGAVKKVLLRRQNDKVVKCNIGNWHHCIGNGLDHVVAMVVVMMMEVS